MRYKVGDRVKYVKKIIHHNVVTGGIFTITHKLSVFSRKQERKQAMV